MGRRTQVPKSVESGREFVVFVMMVMMTMVDNDDDYPYVLYNLNPPRSFCIDDILSHKTAALQRGGPPSMQGNGDESDDDDNDENDDDYEQEEEQEEYGGDIWR